MTCHDLPKNLIVVCCHAIWLGGPSKGQDESEWLLEPFQRGETPTFIEHVRTGLRCLDEQLDSLLVFSGGPTKAATRLSEAESYYNLAMLLGPCSETVTFESQALDSYQNLLFSLLRFHAVTGTWPVHLTLITHAFKRARFEQLHLAALRWPADPTRWRFCGVDPPESVTSHQDLIHGESERGWGPWSRDLYGAGEFLKGKRRKRNVWGQGDGLDIPTDGLEDGVTRLLTWSGPGIFSDPLPWA